MLILSNPAKAGLIAFFVIISVSAFGPIKVAMFMVILLSSILLYRTWVNQRVI